MRGAGRPTAWCRARVDVEVGDVAGDGVIFTPVEPTRRLRSSGIARSLHDVARSGRGVALAADRGAGGEARRRRCAAGRPRRRLSSSASAHRASTGPTLRRPAPASWTTPSTGSPSMHRPICTAHSASPRANSVVPSIGSMYQQRARPRDLGGRLLGDDVVVGEGGPQGVDDARVDLGVGAGDRTLVVGLVAGVELHRSDRTGRARRSCARGRGRGSVHGRGLASMRAPRCAGHGRRSRDRAGWDTERSRTAATHRGSQFLVGPHGGNCDQLHR
jgi:hypothetical protein